MAENVHGTAIVLGTTGVLFVGPSGSGKSTVALHCLIGAERSGIFAALVSDDQVIVTRAGEHMIARTPSSIKGLIEMRGSGIAKIKTIDAAILQCAIMPIRPPFAERIAPENEVWNVSDDAYLPLSRVHFAGNGTDFDLLRTVLPSIGAF